MVRSCTQILKELLSILVRLMCKDLVVREDLHGARKLLEEATRNSYVTISLSRYYELCEVCPSPEELSKCLRFVKEILDELETKTPLPGSALERYVQKVEQYLTEIEHRRTVVSRRLYEAVLRERDELRARAEELAKTNAELQNQLEELLRERDLLRGEVKWLSLEVTRLREVARRLREERDFLAYRAGQWRVLYETYLMLAASLSCAASRLFEENEQLRREVERLRRRVAELEHTLETVIETVRNVLPERAKRRVLETVRRTLLGV